MILSSEIVRTTTSEVLFRGNSVGTKAFDYFLKMVGGQWLSALAPLIKEITLSEDMRCEVQPLSWPSDLVVLQFS